MHYTWRRLWSDESGFWQILVGAGIQGAISYFGSKNAANASKDAAQIQADAANKAVDLQAAIYAQQRADQAPWLHYGNEALSTMGSLMGLGGFTGAQVSTPGLNTGGPGGSGGPGGDGQVPFDPKAGTSVPGPGDLGFGWSPGDPSGNVNDGLPIPFPDQKQGGPGIPVQMPNGEVIEVQLYELQDAIRLGGVVVGTNISPDGSTVPLDQGTSIADVAGGGGPNAGPIGTVGDIPGTPVNPDPYQQYQ